MRPAQILVYSRKSLLYWSLFNKVKSRPGALVDEDADVAISDIEWSVSSDLGLSFI